ncbi:MAG: glutamate--tRNA ligase [Nanobdellota archaeon]
MEERIRILALENAVKFKGTANPGSIIGKLLSDSPELKSEMKTLSGTINKIVTEVNAMSPEEQEHQLLELKPDFYDQQQQEKAERQKKRNMLPPLKNAAEGAVITRMPPEPSKYNHVGHALSFLINYLYAHMYKGRCVLRLDDTNPEMARQEYVDAIFEDVVDYLGLRPDTIVYASDYMETYYEFAEQLIQKGSAYTCSCTQETMSEGRRGMKACGHRDKAPETILSEWKQMKQGKLQDHVLRLKEDMTHKNAVMRDPTIYRVCTTPHYRQKDTYHVWPLYDFETAVQDGMNKVTHIIRSNEFDSRIELHNRIFSLLGFAEPEFKQYGRFNIQGATTKGREIRALIESGDYIGWDDPRLVTLRALRRRGIVKETFFELVKKSGLSKQQTNIDYSMLAAINRAILDETAKRLFFIEDPVKIETTAPVIEAHLKLQPQDTTAKRVIRTKGTYLIERKDYEAIQEGEVVRLMDCVNLVKEGQLRYQSSEYEDFDGKRVLHWISPVEEQVEVEILMPDLTVKKGISEHMTKTLQPGEVIQFERFGFCRLDEIKDGVYHFWYSHD